MEEKLLVGAIANYYVDVYVAVMDYRSVSIKMYKVRVKKGWQQEEIEEWLFENTDYNSDCYYMCSENEINVKYLLF